LTSSEPASPAAASYLLEFVRAENVLASTYIYVKTIYNDNEFEYISNIRAKF